MATLEANLGVFLQWLLKATVQGSLLVCLILLIKMILRERLGARWHYYLWLVLLLRLILPWAPQSRISLYNLIPNSLSPYRTSPGLAGLSADERRTETDSLRWEGSPSPASATDQARTALQKQGGAAGSTTSRPPFRTAVSSHQESSQASGQGHLLASLVVPALIWVWLSGAVILAGYIFVKAFRLWQTVTPERPVTNQEILELLEDGKLQMRVRTLVGVVVTDKVRTPALFGFLRPRILLPQGLIETLGLDELHYVFLHELAHLRRRDIYLGWLVCLLQVVHWFNPVLWYAFRRMRADQELAADALALATAGAGESPRYGQAILKLLERFARPQYLPSLAGILENPSHIERRMTMIARFKNNSYRWSPMAAILIVILGCISVPDAKHGQASAAVASKPVREPTFRKIRMPTQRGGGVLSPDGDRLAFVSDGSVWVVPVRGKVSRDIAGEPVRLGGTEGAWGFGMSWSADGKWIAYNTFRANRIIGICVVPSSGGDIKRIVDNYRAGGSNVNYRLALSPDGKTVAFASIEKESRQIFTVNVEGGGVRQLTKDGGAQPAFSPDGKTIAYVKEMTDRPKRDVWVISAAGGSPIQVSDLPGRAGGPIWSPDGEMIAFTRQVQSDEGSKEICIVPVPERGGLAASPTQIDLPLETWDILAGWTPDNKIGVHLPNPEYQAIYTVPASGGNAVQVSPPGYTFSPRWSPDGERIYFRWDSGNIASVPSGGGEIQILRGLGKSVVLPGGGNAVSPHGKKVVVSASQKGSGVNIFSIPIEGGKPTKLTTTPGQDRFPCWSPDGESIAFVRYPEPSKEMNICIVPAGGGEVRQLTSKSHRVKWATIAWSPDGKSIAYFSEDSEIRIVPVQGGESRAVAKVEDASDASGLAWSPDARKIVYSSRGNIRVVPLEGGEPEEIRTGLNAKAGDVSWSPDGKKLAFTATGGAETELWLMEDFLPPGTRAKDSK